MAVKSKNGGLIWEAGIDTGRLVSDANKVENIFKKLTENQVKEEKNLLRNISSSYAQIATDGRRAFSAMTPQMQNQIVTVNKLNNELRKIADTQRYLDQEFRKGTITEAQYLATTNQLTASTRSLNAQLERQNQTVARSTKTNALYNQVLASTVGFLSIQQGTRLISDIVRTRGEIEQLEVAFTTMLRSKEAATQLMAEIVDVAVETPFKLTEVASATKQLLAYGFAQKEIKNELISIGNIASGVGASFGDIAYAYGTLRAQGRAYAYDIRQFTGRGIPIIEELSKVMNVSTQEVQALVEAGKVGFPEVQKAFQNLSGAGGQFFNLMEKQSQTVTGQISKLQDQIELMFNEIGKSNEGAIRDVTAGAAFIVENYQTVIKALEVLIATYGVYRTALAINLALTNAVSAGEIKSAGIKGLLTLATGKLTAAQRALNIVLAANPYVAVATVLAALVASLYLFRERVKQVEDVQVRLNRATEETNKYFTEQEAKIKTLVSTLGNQNVAESVRLKAYEELKSISPDIVKGLTFEEAKTGDLTKAVYGYVDALEKRLRVENLTNEAVQLRGEISEKEQKLLESRDKQARLKAEGKTISTSVFVDSPYEKQRLQSERLVKELENLYNQEKQLGDQIASNLDQSNNSAEDRIAVLKRLQGQVSETSVAYKKYEDEIKSLQSTIEVVESKPSKNKAYFEKIVKENTEALELLDLSSDDFEAKSKEYKDKILEAQKNLDSFGLKGEKGELKRENKDQKDAIKEREKILNQISNLEDKAYKKSFDKREKEKADLKRQLDEIRELVKDAGFQNANGILNRIDNLELKATGDIDYRNDTEQFKTEFEKRKKIYEDYENHVRDFGVTSADKRFSSELEIAKNYLGTIQSEYEKILTIAPENRSGVQQERLRYFQIILDTEKREQEAQLEALLKANQSYQQQRTALLENQTEQRKKIEATGDLEALATFEKNAEKALFDLNEVAAKDLTGFSEFFDNVRLLSRKAAFEGIDVLKKAIEKLSKLDKEKGGIDPDLAAEWVDQLNQAAQTIGAEIPQEMQKWATSMNSIAQSVSEINQDLGAMFGTIGDIIGGLANVQLGFNELQTAQQTENKTDDFTAKSNLYATAINSVVKLTNLAVNASKQRRQVEEKYYQSVIGYQQDYNLALVEQMRLQSEASGSVFLTNYQGKLENGYLSLTEASKGFNEALKELDRVQVKTGTESFFDLKAAAGATGIGAIGGAAIGALGAAAVGAAIGSVVPILGTAIGAGVGAIVGIFAGKKKKNSYGELLEEFPDLIQTSADGLVAVNEELAKAILANDLIREGGKELVENVLEWGEAVEAAREQITQTIGELTGQIGGELRNALVDAFRNGTDAGLAMTSTVGKAIEDMVSQLLFSAVFSDVFKSLEDDLVKSLDPISGDQSVIDDFDRFLEKAGPAQETFFDLMDQIQKQAAGKGIDIFKPGSSGSLQQPGLVGAIRKELTEATGSELAGLFRGFYDLQKIANNVSYEHLAVANSQLASTMAIQVNTAQTVVELRTMAVDIKAIVKNTKPAQNGRDLGDG
ncbi:tape measure domain-containing protein [Algoriphagus iocasae]|uniref:Tape measure domain-containing protein n=1 Tax=Algoriphagus iocasae TaxID=1836499 RepID=A0A841MG27_9BACT|nr:tape measure protein [Algoriphagus iocasae]MBB6327122.1 tape measure domain-containing protein [Algoriphagus iocasae]